jgi:S1-C subfamily serine protease
MMHRFSKLHRVAFLAVAFLASGALIAFAQAAADQAGNTPAATGGNEKGVLVAFVDPGSPAAQAGIARGDIILAADGKDLANFRQLVSAVDAHKSGDAISLKIQHGDAQRTLAITLGALNGRPLLGIVPYIPFAQRGGMYGRQNRQPPRASGVRIVNVISGSPADKAGLKTGDVVESVDGVKVEPRADLSATILQHKVGETVTLSVRTDGQAARDVKVTLDKNSRKPDSPYLGIEYTWLLAAPMMGMLPPFALDNGPDGTAVKTGVLVRTVTANSPADKAGLKARDLITAIDGVPVAIPRAIYETIANHKPGDSLTLTVYRFSEDKESKLVVTLGQAPQAGKPQGTTTQGAPSGAFLGITMSRYVGWEGPDFEGPLPSIPGALDSRRPMNDGMRSIIQVPIQPHI